MNNLQKYMLDKQISLKDAKRITGNSTIYCRQAMSGQLVDSKKVDEFLEKLKSYFN